MNGSSWKGPIKSKNGYFVNDKEVIDENGQLAAIKSIVVTLTATEIVGTAAGDIGHTGGAILVPAQEGVIHEFVSATLVYKYSGAAYTGGDDDLVVRNGTTAVSAAIAKADLLADSASDNAYVNALAAADIKVAPNTSLNLKGTAYTQPGSAAGTLDVHILYRDIAV